MRAVSYFDSSRMETWISFFFGGVGGLTMLKIDSAGGGKAFQILVLAEFIAEGKLEISSVSSRTFN